jgi:hypothetical protein
MRVVMSEHENRIVGTVGLFTHNKQDWDSYAKRQDTLSIAAAVYAKLPDVVLIHSVPYDSKGRPKDRDIFKSFGGYKSYKNKRDGNLAMDVDHATAIYSRPKIKLDRVDHFGQSSVRVISLSDSHDPMVTTNIYELPLYDDNDKEIIVFDTAHNKIRNSTDQRADPSKVLRENGFTIQQIANLKRPAMEIAYHPETLVVETERLPLGRYSDYFGALVTVYLANVDLPSIGMNSIG